MMNELATAAKYESYKETGIEWLPEIPAEWNVEKAKWLFFKAERPVDKDDEIVTCFRDGQVTLRSNRRKEGFTTALKEHGYQGVRKGDLVIHAMDAFAGAIGVSDSDGKSTPVYAACLPRIPNIVNPSFYAYYMRDLALSGFIVSLAKGIRERSTDFRFNDFAQLPLPLPSLEAQNKIVSFLDNKTSKIDEAILIKEKQISLLKERKQIIIQKAVTQGLNPRVPMKDSGVVWIGEIPSHWQVKKFKYVLQKNGFVRGPFGSALQTSSFTKSGFKVYEQKNAIYDDITIGNSYIPYRKYRELARFRVRAGDFLMSCSGTIGKISQVPKEFEAGIINQAMLIIRIDKNFFMPEFFRELFKSDFMQSQFIENSKGSAMKNLVGTEIFKNMKMALPPIDEQTDIYNFIERNSRLIDQTIEIQLEQINKLKEYKATLINSAVTGKIKVA